MSNNLHIFLFGGLTIELNSKSLSSMTRKSQALFAYLACHPQQMLRREFLATLLWSEKDEKGAMGNLRTALSGLRELAEFLKIERFAIGAQSSNALQAGSSIWVDVQVFEKLEQIALRTPPSGLLTDAELSALSEAVSLYRGEFLEGFTLRDADGFDEWSRIQHEHFHVDATRALQKLVTHYLAAEDYQAGIAWARRLIELIPEDEAPRRDMMRLLAGSGQISAAVQEYELLKRHLSGERAEPALETTRLYKQLLNSGRRTVAAEVAIPPPNPPPTNLAQPLTSIIGRQQEIDRIAHRLADERCRLITLVGAGGVGKTRLASEAGLHLLEDIEARQQFQDGIYFITLQSIDQPALLPNAIASIVGCQMQGVVDPETQLLAYLRPRQMLLILDNFEHLLEASELVLHILQQAPSIKVLTTSLEPLNFQGEWLLQVAGLPIPTTLQEQDWDEFPAVQLFIRTVEQFDPDFVGKDHRQSIIDICQQLQGLPLGILLAASAVRAYSCQTIAEELRRNLDFLATTMRNIPLRHRSLRAVFDYVWNLLDVKARELLPRLAVFEGGFSSEAAQAVADIRPPYLVEYADRSLLQKTLLTSANAISPSNPPNPSVSRETQGFIYTIHRALHGYLLEKLAIDKDNYQAVRRRHCDYFIAVLEKQQINISGAEMGQALTTIQNQLADIRSAWHYAVTQSLLAKIAASYEALAQFYLRIGPFVEGENALRLAANAVRQTIGLHASLGNNESNGEGANDSVKRLLARLVVHTCQFQIELAFYTAALEEMPEADALAIGLQDTETMAMLHLLRGRANYYMGAHETARQQLEHAYQFTSQQPLPRIEAQLELYLGNVYGAQGNYQASRQRLLQGLEFCQRDHDPLTELLFYRSLGRNAFFAGEYSEATALFEQVLNGYNNLGARAGTGIVLNNLGALLHQVGDFERAREHYSSALEVLRDIGDLRVRGLATANLCLLSYHMNDNLTALSYGHEALTIANERNDRDGEAYVRNCLGHVWRAQNDLKQAEEMYQQALAIRIALAQPGSQLEPMAGLAAIALDKQDLASAIQYVEPIYNAVIAGQPGGVVEFIKVLLVCFDTFNACKDPRAEEIVQLGAKILSERASKISKPSHRRSFLWRVASQRRMLTLAEEYKILLPEWLLRTS